MNQLFKKGVWSLLFCFCIASHGASNEELYALQKTTVGSEEVFLNGMGMVRKLNNEYYLAALYLQTKSSIDSDIIFYETNKRLEIRFAITRASGRGFGRELASSLKLNNVADELDAYRNELRSLVGLFRGTYKKGDTLQFDVQKGRLIVRLNGNEIGRFSKNGFDKVFMKAWLGEKPLSQRFKLGLVGNNDDKHAIELLRKYVDMTKS